MKATKFLKNLSKLIKENEERLGENPEINVRAFRYSGSFLKHDLLHIVVRNRLDEAAIIEIVDRSFKRNYSIFMCARIFKIFPFEALITTLPLFLLTGNAMAPCLMFAFQLFFRVSYLLWANYKLAPYNYRHNEFFYPDEVRSYFLSCRKCAKTVRVDFEKLNVDPETGVIASETEIMAIRD